jgi:hypothetical protein
MSAEVPATDTPPPVRYRHFTVPPATVRLTVDDLTTLLPDGVWIGTEADKKREVTLPTTEILEKNFPRIRLSRLADLLPGCLRVEGAPDWIALPADRVVLAYHPESRREKILEPGEEPAPEPAPEPAAEEKRRPGWKKIPKPELAPVPPPKPIPLGERTFPAEEEKRLQHIFLTEDALPVAHLVDLAGKLPSLQGCALTHGAEHVRSENFPAGIDVPALADTALDLLPKAGHAHGLRFLPTLTLYAESGPISLLHRGDYRMVVVHRERGFLPGVREKIDAALEMLAALPKA